LQSRPGYGTQITCLVQSSSGKPSPEPKKGPDRNVVMSATER
jgi:hypothetical protein